MGRVDETPTGFSRSPSERKPRRPRRIPLLVLGSALALCGAEVGLRGFVALAHPSIYELDPRLGWRHAARIERRTVNERGERVLFCTDARGLRATPYPSERTPGRARVLFVGDSFTQGAQVEEQDLFTTAIARELPGVEVWNTSVGGWSTVQEFLWLRAEGTALRPDLVVRVLSDHDLEDNVVPYHAGLGPRPYARLGAAGEVEVVEAIEVGPFARFLMPAPGRWWLYRHSALYRSLLKNLFLPVKAEELGQLQEAERNAVPEVESRAVMADMLRRVEAVVRAAGARTAIVAIPTREQAAAAASPDHAWMAARCGALGVPFLSLTEALAAKSDSGEPAYFERDIHLTRTGHQLVARPLVSFLRAALP